MAIVNFKNQGDWAEARKHGVGGSDIGSIMGHNPWSSPLQVWKDKIDKDYSIPSNFAMFKGSEEEGTVAKWFESEFPSYKTRKPNGTYVEGIYIANIDRLIENSDLILECKTCDTLSPYVSEFWSKNIIPPAYFDQVNWYCGIANKKGGYVACAIGNRECKIIEFSFNSSYFETQKMFANEFWKFVTNRKAPSAKVVDMQDLAQIYGTSTEIIDCSEIKDYVDKYVCLQNMIKDKEAEIKPLKSSLEDTKVKILDFLKGNQGQCDGYLLKNTLVNSKSLDKKLMEKDNIDLTKYEKPSSYYRLTIKETGE